MTKQENSILTFPLALPTRSSCQSVEEVRLILYAIEQRDPEKAAVACSEHVQNAAKAALSGLTHQQKEQQEMTERGMSL